MKSCTDLDSMLIDELWALRELVVAELTRRIKVERSALDMRLRQLGAAPTSRSRPAQRPSPAAPTKYRNPNNHRETWTGRGRQPRWLADKIRSGKKLADFLID
jgi:DNA-binding protein H-NS